VVGRDDDGKRTEATMKKIRGKENVVRSNDERKRVMRAALKSFARSLRQKYYLQSKDQQWSSSA
jgi:hypothetical protein